MERIPPVGIATRLRFQDSGWAEPSDIANNCLAYAPSISFRPNANEIQGKTNHRMFKPIHIGTNQDDVGDDDGKVTVSCGILVAIVLTDGDESVVHTTTREAIIRGLTQKTSVITAKHMKGPTSPLS